MNISGSDTLKAPQMYKVELKEVSSKGGWSRRTLRMSVLGHYMAIQVCPLHVTW